VDTDKGVNMNPYRSQSGSTEIHSDSLVQRVTSVPHTLHLFTMKAVHFSQVLWIFVFFIFIFLFIFLPTEEGYSDCFTIYRNTYTYSHS